MCDSVNGHTHPRSISLAMITMININLEVSFSFFHWYGSPHSGPWGRRMSTTIKTIDPSEILAFEHVSAEWPGPTTTTKNDKELEAYDCPYSLCFWIYLQRIRSTSSLGLSFLLYRVFLFDLGKSTRKRRYRHPKLFFIIYLHNRFTSCLVT